MGCPRAVLENVSYTHWNRAEPTLRNLSLSFERGTLTLLTGPGGSGKSTLASLFNGAAPQLLGGVLEGRVVLDGKDAAESRVCDLARGCGHLFQDPETMFATLYVEDEIAFGPENLNVPPEAIRASVDALLEQVDLGAFRRGLVWNLSGGQVQKLSLAAVLAMEPDLVVLDEPTANLDPVSAAEVHAIAAKLKEKGAAVILITRELDDFLLKAADRLLVLDRGRVRVDAPVREALECSGLELLGLGLRLPETAELAVRLLGAGDGRCADLPFGTPEAYAALREWGYLTDAPLRGPASGQGGRPPREGEILVRADGLRFSYSKERETLKGVSFELRAGELVALVGRNGAGKSTLSKLLVGLLKPSAGSLELFGKASKKWKTRDLAEAVSLVFQNPEHQFLTDTVRDEIAYSLASRGLEEGTEMDERIAEALGLMQLEAFADAHPFALSAGMKRRLGVATMLVGKPRLLIVDEPTYGQDARMTATLMAVLDDLRRSGVGIAMITHDMRLVQEYADRVLVLNEGAIGYDGSPAGLFEEAELLVKAKLKPTQLWELLALHRRAGCSVDGGFRRVDDLIGALRIPGAKETAHGL